MGLSERQLDSVIAETRGSLLVSGISPVGIASADELLQEFTILNFDIVHSESYSYSSQVTRSPVEEGIDITDHITREPVSISIEASISDTPVVVLGLTSLEATDVLQSVSPDGSLSKRISDTTGGNSAAESTKPRSRVAFEELVRLIEDNKHPVTLVTGLEIYPVMVITSFNINRSPSTGQRLRFSISLEEVVFVSTEETTISADTARLVKAALNAPIRNAGPQAGESGGTAGELDKASALYKLLKKIFDMFKPDVAKAINPVTP